MDHDHSYKLLFSHPQMVRDLLIAFVTGEWLDDADFGSLERRSGDYVADDLRARADDIVWRIRCGQRTVYLLLEFQSSPDRFMAVRVLTYVGLLYQDLIRSSKGRGVDTLPAILPIVLHSGDKTWSAAEDVTTLLDEAPKGLQQYRPHLRYLLIDESSYDDTELAGHRNMAAILFRLEQCRRPELMQQLLITLGEWLQGPELAELRRAFAVWLERVVLKRLSDEHTRITNNLWENPSMLHERAREWEKEFQEKGRQEGRLEGEAILLTRLLQKRFGQLPERVGARVRNASVEQLETWVERLLDAASLDDVFGAVRG